MSALLQAPVFIVPQFLPQLQEDSDDTVASASTIDLTGLGRQIDVTGTTTINNITLPEGEERVLRYLGNLTITNSASILCPGGENIAVTAGGFQLVHGNAGGVVNALTNQDANDYSRQTFENIYVRNSGRIGFDPTINSTFDLGSHDSANETDWFFRFLKSGAPLVLLNDDPTVQISLRMHPDTEPHSVFWPKLAGSAAEIVTTSGPVTLTNKSIDASQLTGSIAAARMPALTGDVTSSAGTVSTTIAAGVVTFAKMATGAWSDDVTMAADSSTLFITQHAAKTYADNLQTNIRWKVNCRVASTANVTVSNPGTSTFDGVVLSSGDRILLKNQSTASQNGPYIFNGSSSAMTRTTDGDTGTELISATFPISEGTVNQDTWWTVTNDSITIGSTSIVFSQTGGAGTYTNGSGLALTGNSFSIATAGITFGMINAAMIDDTSDGISAQLEDAFPTCFAVNAWVSGQTAGFVLTSTLSQSATGSSVAQRDTNGVLTATNFNEGYTTTATAAGTTTLSQTDTGLQYFTGSTTQTVKLPVASTMALGQAYVIVNNSSGAVTVQSSGANTIKVLAGGTQCTFTCILASGTGTASWSAWYLGSSITTAKKLSVSNSLTLAGTDGTTMTFPGTSATIARTDAANTFAGNQTFSAIIIASAQVRLKGYTVATLPAGTQGDTAFCTDLLAPGFLVAAVGGGAVVGPVFYNGGAWVAY